MSNNSRQKPAPNYCSTVQHTNTTIDFSSFIEDLQQTTQKIVQEVFNDQQFTLRGPLKQTLRNITFEDLNTSKVSNAKPNVNTFLRRMEYFEKIKQGKLQMLHSIREDSIDKNCTHHPKINPSNIQIAPIQQRYPDILLQKGNKIKYKQLQNKYKSDKQINSFSFKPRINQPKGTPRTFEQYYQQKKKWNKRKEEVRQKNRQAEQAKKQRQCSFKPEIATVKSSFYRNNLLKNKHTKVQERLLSSLEKSCERKQALSQHSTSPRKK